MSRKYPLKKSFGFALEGLRVCIKEEPNFKIHILFALLATLLAFYLSFAPFEWLVLILVITFVFALELINTSLEALVDLLSPEKKEAAKKAKDVAAAAVFVSALGSVLVGILLFAPKLLKLF